MLSQPPFQVVKLFGIKQAQVQVKDVAALQRFWAARDDRPTDRWY